MKLRWAAGSPFVRKVMVTAMETGLDGRIERVETDHRDTKSDLSRDNPLGKIPALIPDNGAPALIESGVICAYLDSLHDGTKLFPAEGQARWDALWLEALADGMTEAAIAVARENARPDGKQWDEWQVRQWQKVMRAMDALEARAVLLNGPLSIGTIAVACSLGWIEARLGEQLGDWDERCPGLAAWYRGFAVRPSMQATQPPP